MDVGGRAIRPLGVQLIGCQDRDPPRPGSVSIPPGRHLGRSEWSRQPSGEVVGSSRPGRDVGHRRSDDGETSWRYPRMGRMDEKSARRTLDRGRDAARSHAVAVGESGGSRGSESRSSAKPRRPRAPAGGGSGRTCWPGCRAPTNKPRGRRATDRLGRREADRAPESDRRIRRGSAARSARPIPMARRTQGWSQPARASAVDSTTMAASRKPATATFRVPRQRNERLMEGNDLADRR